VAGLRWVFRDLMKAPDIALIMGIMLLLLSSPAVYVCLFSTTLPLGIGIFFGIACGAGILIGLILVFSGIRELAYPGTLLFRLTHLPAPRKLR